MKSMFQFVKTAALVFIGASLVVSCQKDTSGGGEITTENGEKVTVKSAPVVVSPEYIAKFGTSENWLGTKGVLSFLRESKAIDPAYLKDVPTGIEMLRDGYLYVTYVGKVAAFNNVLGYYYYDPQELAESSDPQKFILEQIFASGKDLKVNQVVYAQTTGLAFGTTYQLGAYEGAEMVEFPKGTVVGFYLLPNASKGADANDIKLSMKDGKPVFIATDAQLNRTKEASEGKVSHIMGKSACGDLVIAFEDRNSLYSVTSDEDFNDLVFVIGDNLETRYTSTLNYYTAPGKPFDLDDANVFGAEKNCLECTADDKIKTTVLTQIFKEGENKTLLSQFDALFGGASRDGYIELTGATQLYSYREIQRCGFYNTVGWYYYESGQTVDDIKKSVTVDGTVTGTIKPEHVIYENITGWLNSNPDGFVALNKGTKLAANAKIGFFIIPKSAAQTGGVTFAAVGGNAPKFTTINDPDKKTTQAQLIMSGSCNSLMVAFEDKTSKPDYDYNDVLFSLSDNNSTLKVTNIKFANFYSLAELIDALGL